MVIGPLDKIDAVYAYLDGSATLLEAAASIEVNPGEFLAIAASFRIFLADGKWRSTVGERGSSAQRRNESVEQPLLDLDDAIDTVGDEF